MTTLVIDVGSSSVRALLMDENARLIADGLARQTHRFSADSTADAVQLRGWVEDCIDVVLKHPAAQSITAVGMATFVGNVLGINDSSNPITPIYTYADTRSSADAEMLAQSHDIVTVHKRTGCRIHPAYHPAKLHWLRRTQPELFNSVSRWTDFATYCYSVWFGRDVPCSYSVASWSGLLNRTTLDWDNGWLEAIHLNRGTLPPLADFTDVQQGLTHEYAQRWPLLRDVPFYLAVGDGAAANIGSGGTTERHPVLTVGTTAAMRIVTTTQNDVPTGLWAYRVDATRHLIGGATSEGGNIFAWAQDTFQLDSTDLDDSLIGRKPGAHGLTVLPLFTGERSPGYRADATGTILGMRLETSPIDILHALLEGVALRLRLIYDLMGRPGQAVRASGGALVQSAAWRQIMADCLGVPLHLVDGDEATARGVAVLITQNETHAELPIAHIITPHPAVTEQVNALLHRHTQLYARLYGDDSGKPPV